MLTYKLHLLSLEPPSSSDLVFGYIDRGAMDLTIFKISVFSLIVLCRLASATANHAELSVVLDTPDVIRLYERVRNQEPPSELDPALRAPHTRQHICNDITRSGFFYWRRLSPVKMWQIYLKLRRPQYSEIFHQIYEPLGSNHPLQRLRMRYKYSNRFVQVQLRAGDAAVLELSNRTISVVESVFVCLMKSNEQAVLPVYVSKEYNLFGKPYMPGRFLFMKPMIHVPIDYYQILLAEQPAAVFEGSNFNVELHYLEMRKHRQPVENKEDDPICRLMSSNRITNPFYRLCVEIYGSPYFKDKLKYLKPWTIADECSIREVSFRTAEGIREAAGKSYFEFMTSCETRKRGHYSRISFYISRAYRRNEVFVYSDNSNYADFKYYLENRSINIGAIDEPLSLNDVE